jgi:hypothetical protein
MSTTTSVTTSAVNITSTVTLNTSITTPTVPDFSSIGAGLSSGLSNAASIITNTLSEAANGLSISTPSFVNLPKSQVANNIISFVNAPQWPSTWNGTFLTVGNQTSPGLARGALTYTGVNITNTNLTHSCDFKFQFPNLGLNFGIVDPVAAIKKAIAKGKLAAKMAIQMAMSAMNDAFRNAMKSLLAGLGLDATGQFSLAFSVSKGTLENVNNIINKILRYITLTSLVYNLLKDLQQLITYIQSLPAQIKAILQECLAKFTNSLTTSIESAKSITSQITNMTALNVANDQASGTTVNPNTASTVAPILSSLYSGTPPSDEQLSALTGAISTNISTAAPSQSTKQAQGEQP